MNRGSKIRVREMGEGIVRTETVGRDEDAVNFAVSTNERLNSTTLYVNSYECGTLVLNGQQARTLFKLLNKHYTFTGKI